MPTSVANKKNVSSNELARKTTETASDTQTQALRNNASSEAKNKIVSTTETKSGQVADQYSGETTEKHALELDTGPRVSKVRVSQKGESYQVEQNSDSNDRYKIQSGKTRIEVTAETDKTVIKQYNEEGQIRDRKEYDAKSGALTRKTTFDADGNIKTDDRFGSTKSGKAQWEEDKSRWRDELREVDAEGKKSNSANPLELLALKEYVTPKPTESPPRLSTSKFSTETREQEKSLRSWVLSQEAGADLEPSDIYKKSLELNNGDSHKATLTAYNMLTNVTSSVRGGKATETEKNEDRKIMDRLVSLRPSDTKYSTDKMGPWYHLFGVGVASQYGLGGVASFVSKMGPGGDTEKEAIDDLGRDSF
jgi:hypothetical protein